jgi:hypothetical protein
MLIDYCVSKLKIKRCFKILFKTSRNKQTIFVHKSFREGVGGTSFFFDNHFVFVKKTKPNFFSFFGSRDFDLLKQSKRFNIPSLYV